MLLLVALSLVNAAPPALVQTPLMVDGQPPTILAPSGDGARAAVAKLAAALEQRLGRRPPVVAELAAAPLGKATVIALGNLLDNPLLARLYFGHYTFEDALFPGPEGYTLHTVHDPYPWAGGTDIVVLGASRQEPLAAAVDRCLAALTGDGAASALPYLQVVEPSRRLSDAARAKLLGTPPEPSFTAFRQNAELYLKSGDEGYAQQAIAALEIMAGVYTADPKRHVPWPEETTSGDIAAAWDAFYPCPLIPEAKRQLYFDTFLNWCRGLPPNSYEYRALKENYGVTWNHTTFPLLGCYFGARFFTRYTDLPEPKEWLQKARWGFTSQAKSWKPQEDADDYSIYTPLHTIDYSLGEWDLTFFENGNMKRFADYIVGIGDNRGWAAGFGDSGYGTGAYLVRDVLPIAFWWTRDGGYRWILDHDFPKPWDNPYWQDVPAVRPDHYVGLNVFPMDRQIYDYTQTQPVYGEGFAPSDVTYEQAFDKIAFRENWDNDGQYFLLDGLGRGKHLHFDTGNLVEFVQSGERWLLDHDYLVRNTTEHNMFSVLRDARGATLVPSLAALEQSGDLPTVAAVTTRVKAYNGIDWERRLLWRKGAWILVRDTATAREAGRYDVELTWKTIDRGAQSVDPQGRFVARKPAVSGSNHLVTVADPAGTNGQVALMGSPDSCLACGVDLPAGTYVVSVVAQGVDGSSDSVWLSFDGGPPEAHHIPQGQLGPSRGSFDGAAAVPKLVVAKGGRHSVLVTLRENPPVRLDRIEFSRQGAPPVVVPAVNAPAPPAGAAVPDSVFHIDSAAPLSCRVTNHVRQGISVPISILHQRQGGELQPGQRLSFCSLLYANDATHKRSFGIAPLREHVWRLGTGVAAGFGADRSGNWACDAAAWLVEGTRVDLLSATSLTLGAGRIRVEPAADLSLDAATGRLTVVSRAAVTVSGELVRGLEQPQALAPGTHTLSLKQVDSGALSAASSGRAAPATAAQAAGALKADRQPLWRAAPKPGGAVARLLPAELDGKPTLLVAAGNSALALAADGSERWRYGTAGLVRDVSVAHFTRGATTVMVSSADTWLYLLDPAGALSDKHQMTGIYFSADHGERPWPLYLTRAVDSNGDGVDDLIVTTLGSMEALGYDPQFKKLWRTLAAYHGCMDIKIRDVNGDGKPEILTADKYGRAHVMATDGRLIGGLSTSIGDVAFETADLDGDGKTELLNGSSTGDLAAGDLRGEVKWRFDNYGYPVNRIVCTTPAGGKPDVLVASGTGYLYCLDKAGKQRWARRLGFAVTDVVVTPEGIVCGTADAQAVGLDSEGQTRWVADVGAAVTCLAVWGDRVAVGCADGSVALLGP